MTTSPDESFIAHRCSFGSSSGARGNTNSLFSTTSSSSSMLRGSRTNGMGQSDGVDAGMKGGGVSDKMDEVEDILAMLREEDASGGSYIFINAEGKCNTEDQVRTLLGSVRARVGMSWFVIIVAEADWLTDDRSSEDRIDGHAVYRHYVAGGRAMKVILNRRILDFLQAVVWTNRAVRVDLCFNYSQRVGLSILGSHFAHGADWDSTYQELTDLIEGKPPTHLLYVSGDFNVEFRPHAQTSGEHEKADLLQSTMTGLGLSMGFQPTRDIVTRVPSGLSALINSPSLLDMGYVPSSGKDYAWCTLEDKPGDHGFVITTLQGCPMPVDTGYRGRKWRCVDEEAFQTFVASSVPSSFHCLSDFHRFVRDAMDEFDDHRSAKQRRREWEPKRLKELRRQLRLCCDLQQRHNLQKRIFQIRVQMCKTNRLNQSAAELKAGRAKGKKSMKLFRIDKMNVDGRVLCDHTKWSEAVDKEFEERWRQTNHEDLLLFEQLGGMQEIYLDIDPAEVLEACSAIKKPKRRDLEGVCCQAIRLCAQLHAPLALLLAKTMASDAAMSDISLVGFVKAKLRGVITADKTRGLVPQLALLQIMDRIVQKRVTPTLDTFSFDRSTKGLLLGSGKGGQTRDVVFCASQVLEKGRDRFNSAAVALGDIRKCYDELPWGHILKGFLRRNVAPSDAIALLRCHRCPQLRLKVGSVVGQPLRRSRSALTGCSSSGLLARIIVEDSFEAALPLFRDVFVVDEHLTLLPAMSWSDNLLVFASSIETAV